MNDKAIEKKFIKEISNMDNDELIDWIDDYLDIRDKREILGEK